MLGSNLETLNMSIFTIVIAPIIVLIIILNLSKYGKARKLPPGDVGWPVLVSTNFMTSQSPAVLSNFIKEQLSKHGKIFTTRILGHKIIISADADLNTFVSQNDGKLFDNDMPPHIIALFGESDLFLMADEQRYKDMKSMIINFLHSWEIHTTFLEHVQNVADRVVGTLKHKDVVYASEEAKRFVFSIMVQEVVGLSAEDPEGEQLCKELFRFDQGIFAVPIHLPNTIYWKALKARKYIVNFIKKRVERNKMEEKKNTKPKDWIDWLLEKDPHQSAEKIFDSTIPIFFGLVVNNAKAIALAIYFLGNCPKAVQQMRDEYQEIMEAKKNGKAKLTWEDYKKLKFSQCVMDETLRLGNIAPGLSKKARQDIDFEGYVIPKGFNIITYTAAVHLDPGAFERPEEFDPWRWQNVKKPNSWMPFGRGVRHCNGSEIARIETAIFLNYFLSSYNWEAVEPDHPIAQPISFPKGLPIKVYPLNTDH